MPVSPSILFADRTPENQISCLQLFEEYAPSNVHLCSDPEELSANLDSIAPNILFIDLLLFPEDECIVILDSILEKHPDLLLVAAIPHENNELEQQIIKRNLFFYVSIPYEDSEIQLALKRATTKLNLNASQQNAEALNRMPPFYGIIGETSVMQNLFNLITKVSTDDA